jgi:hypothetical protein
VTPLRKLDEAGLIKLDEAGLIRRARCALQWGRR